MRIELHIGGECKHAIEIPAQKKWVKAERGTTIQEAIHHAVTVLKRIGEKQKMDWEVFIYHPSKMNAHAKPADPPVIKPTRAPGKYSNHSPYNIAS